MLRQDHGADETNVVARAPKVILSVGESTVKLQGRGGEGWWSAEELGKEGKSECQC